jgi:2-polyprenyl-6-methoxyphenol hydroxylase-like FAD-dependent oxidoreductase
MGTGTAVVIGGSVAGLLAARALSEALDRVVVVERDELLDEPHQHRGVPQGRQTHMLLPVGTRALEDLLPGYRQGLLDAGCLPYDRLVGMALLGGHGWRARGRSRVEVLAVERPVIEQATRRRVRALERVEIRHAAADGLLLAPGDDRVRGVRLAGERAALEADLVIDAGGRGTRVTRWLREAGVPGAVEHHTQSHYGYATRLVHVPHGALPDGVHAIAALPRADHTRGGLITPVSGGRHFLTALGSRKDYPPTDETGFLHFLRDAPTPLLGRIAALCEPLEPIASYHIDGTQRHRWEDVAGRPGRLLRIGDAVARFNPIYAQGIGVAALQAQRLRDRLLAVDGDLDALCTAFDDDLREVLAAPWAQATGADMIGGATDLQGVEPLSPASAAFARRADLAATGDLVVAREITRAGGWFEPARMAAPDVVARVRDFDAARRPVATIDPAGVPPLAAEPAADDGATARSVA